jgi:hypothetical protein
MTSRVETSKVAESIRRGLEEALAYAEGTADTSHYGSADQSHHHRAATMRPNAGLSVKIEKLKSLILLAEGVGFEPTGLVNGRRFSRPLL